MAQAKKGKNKLKSRVQELDSSVLASSQGSAKMIKVYDMWKENSNLYVDPIEHQSGLAKTSFNQ